MNEFTSKSWRVAVLCGALIPGAGCEDDDVVPTEAFFPADYESTYTEVRDCRGSAEHDLNNIRVLADASGRIPYEERAEPFPAGAVILKPEYDFGDVTCEGEPVQWTVMRRLAQGSSPDTLDWEWQRVDFDRNVVEEDAPQCIGCHTGCGVAPDGYEGTCAVP